MSEMIALYLVCIFLSCFFVHPGKPRSNNCPMTQQEINIVLDSHNKYRRLQNASNMNMLKWNDTLAVMACIQVNKCVNEHGQPDNPESPFYMTGQNIYATSPYKPANYGLAVQRWYEEIKYYKYDDNSCSKMCGHYTQVVWADTIFVGCAATNCSFMLPQKWTNATMIICNYGPGGNVIDFLPYEIGPGCDMCSTDYPCIDGLCDADY